jgi:hypothetical protein
MANHGETGLFFRLALRVGLVTAMDVEHWVDAVLDSEREVSYPITELAAASRLPRSTVDALLGEFPGPADRLLPGKMVMALITRRLLTNQITPQLAARIGRAVGGVGDLPDGEYERIDAMDDGYALASNGVYGDVETVRQGIRQFFDCYHSYENELPKTL